MWKTFLRSSYDIKWTQREILGTGVTKVAKQSFQKKKKKMKKEEKAQKQGQKEKREGGELPLECLK